MRFPKVMTCLNIGCPLGMGLWEGVPLRDVLRLVVGHAEVRAALNGLIIRRGYVVAEWGDAAKRTELASVRKSLLSALIGIAVAERKISLDSTLAQLGIDDNAPSLTDVQNTIKEQQLNRLENQVPPK